MPRPSATELALLGKGNPSSIPHRLVSEKLRLDARLVPNAREALGAGLLLTDHPSELGEKIEG